MPSFDFSRMHAAMRAQVEQQFLPGVSTAVFKGREVVDVFCHGMADVEAGVALREDHVFRMFSSTKLVTSCAVLLLMEEGRLQLDDPIEAYLPALCNRQVLRPGATSITDTEPARSAITLRHLMSHSAGLSYGMFDPGTVMFDAYSRAGLLNPLSPLSDLVERLAPLPLSFHPGTRWEYSVATDVLGRVVEVVSGQTFGAFLHQRIFQPLGMVDTDFYLPTEKQDRLCALYGGVDLMDPTKPGLVRFDGKPYPGAYLRKLPRESGGGGLVSTLGDTVRFIQSLLPGAKGEATLLRPSTLALMAQNQLPPGVCVEFPNMPKSEGRCFGLGSSVAVAAGPGEPAEVVGEVSWGGLAGTIWWINPRLNIAAVLMTQRYFGFGNPYAFAFKREAYKAMGH